MDALDLRRALVERLVVRRTARSPSVVRALGDVPRHAFLPEISPELAYADRSIALIVEEGTTLSSASQPSMIAEMLEQLDVQPGNRVLEIGTGSGYNAALLAYLAGPRGQVVSIDLDAGLVERARSALRATGFERVRVLHEDGAGGAPEWAPFDRIILTVAADDIVDAWRAQLAPGGRLVLPLTLHALQESIAFEGHDPMRSVSIVGASFVALRGSSAVVSHEIEVGANPVIRLRAGEPSSIDRDGVSLRLQSTPSFVPLEGIDVDDLWGGLDVWLDCHVPAAALAMADGSAEGTYVEDWLSVAHDDGFATTIALCRDDAIALFLRDRRGRIHLACYGAADELVGAARIAIAGWTARGRPSTRALRITAFAQTAPQFADTLIEKASVMLALRWSFPSSG
ncbi:MAG TPA: methyltransferase domain-containing protein [Candidatus Binatia bacterium]|nr:methyltransferase domain-containing protein [Candidatus Binatia bacterium]